MNALFIIIIVLSVTAICFLLLSIFFIIKFSTERKNAVNFYGGYFVLNSVAPMMTLAENNKSLNGTQKKEFVMNKVNFIAKEKGYYFDAVLVSNRIEYIINLSKEINYKSYSDFSEIQV